jgi:hypothetical protein
MAGQMLIAAAINSQPVVHRVDFGEVKHQAERQESRTGISYQALACSGWTWWIDREHPDVIELPPVGGSQQQFSHNVDRRLNNRCRTGEMGW